MSSINNNNNNNKWEIIYIPPNPPFPPSHLPTANVFASVIHPKMAHTLVRKLNKIAPLESFRHLKRVRKRSIHGIIELSVILCLADENDGTELGGMPKDVLELTHSNQLSPFVTQVCKYAATTKEEWEEQSKLWPTSFHPPTYNIEGITGFSEEDTKSVLNYMSFALKLAKSASNQLSNAAVVVDPSVDEIIASACDEISSWLDNKDNGVQSLELDTPSTSHGVANGTSTYKLNLNGCPVDLETSCSRVSCLNPWQWSEGHQQSPDSCFWHPLRHAALVAIEHSAARDMRLFPSTENVYDTSVQDVLRDSSVVGSPAKRLRTSPNIANNSEEAPSNDFLSKSDRPYLCTGYDVYVAWEPCAMCAMALLHQRVRRIFYAFPNPSTGALGSVYRLQGEKSLNHHYAVFRVVLPDELLENTEKSVPIT